MKGGASEKPSMILLVVAPTMPAGRDFVRRELGLGAALALGQVRIITDVRGLRGWRRGTLVSTDGQGGHPADKEMAQALDVYFATGRLRPATTADIDELRAEVLA